MSVQQREKKMRNLILLPKSAYLDLPMTPLKLLLSISNTVALFLKQLTRLCGKVSAALRFLIRIHQQPRCHRPTTNHAPVVAGTIGDEAQFGA
jgi:hypothetical protein